MSLCSSGGVTSDEEGTVGSRHSSLVTRHLQLPGPEGHHGEVRWWVITQVDPDRFGGHPFYALADLGQAADTAEQVLVAGQGAGARAGRLALHDQRA